MEEELHQIEQDDENVAAAIQQVVEEQNRAAAILQEQQHQPSPQMVYDRLVQFEEILKEAWDEFQEKIQQDLMLLQDDVDEDNKVVQRKKTNLMRVISS